MKLYYKARNMTSTGIIPLRVRNNLTSERIHEDNFEQMGIDGLLMKPIITSKLANVVQKVLDDGKSENHE